MKDIRMPTPFTTSKTEKTGMGVNKHCMVAKERERRETDLDESPEHSHYRPGGEWRTNTVFEIEQTTPRSKP